MPISSLLLAAALSAAEPRLHVALAFMADAALAPPLTAVAVQEADNIWSHYGVVVDRSLPCASAPDEAIVLTIRTGKSDAVAASHMPAALGAINFDRHGVPYPIVTVYLDLIRRSVGVARLGDVGEDRWPPDLRQHVVGRALGRVIAHEIGHYLLASRRHSASGLMRPVQSFYELFGQPGSGFLLSRADERRFARSVSR